jgi:hypothetical protein
MNDRYGSFYEPSQNPAYRFTLAREVSLLRRPATRLLGLLSLVLNARFWR